MQCHYVNPNPDHFSESVDSTKIAHFQAHFEGCMEMYSDAQTVAEYFNQHQGWFCRCAEPMKTEPMGQNGYILTVGKYRALGHDVEPKMAVILEPPVNGVYPMYSIPLEGEEHLGYQIDYQASMALKEVMASQAAPGLENAFKKEGLTQFPEVVTKVTWDLHMNVWVAFPKLITKLPWTLVETTGDRLLSEIIRQVSPRLTYKVQQDFHHRMNLPMPSKAGRKFQKISLDTVAA